MIIIKKLSFKLGMLFFLFILLIESMLFSFLYFTVINERVDYETENLLARGTSHRDVLEKNFDPVTRKHVTLMESEAETMVVITDRQLKVLNASNKITSDMQKLMEEGAAIELTHHGEIIESNWKTEPYIATISPLRITGEVKGYVFMFVKTSPIRSMINSLTIQFVIVGLIGIIISIITTIFLSRFITEPILRIKKVTEKLGKGKSDVTLDIYRDDELGELARSIQKLSDDLDTLKKERTEFLSSISHELRTPLTYLKGYADILKRPSLSTKERDEYITIIQEEASNVTRLVKDVFDLAKMDKNQFEIQKEGVEFCNYLREIITKFKPAYDEKQISLNFSCNEHILILLDPIRFGQVINNFLDNALKYSSSKTNVTVSVEKVKKFISIKIADQGFGIPRKELPFIWNRFYRVDKSRSRATGGSGLGLTIAREIIEMHGGKVEATSKLNKGTTFTIYLPGDE